MVRLAPRNYNPFSEQEMTTSFPQLTPPVKQITVSGGAFIFSNVLKVTLFGKTQTLIPALRMLQAASSPRGLILDIHWADTSQPGFGLTVEQINNPFNPTEARSLPPRFPTHPEAYCVAISTTACRLSAQTPEGLFRGSATLAALLRENEQSIPCAYITDWPDKSIRGLMLDVSRNRIWSLETLFWIVDQMAQLKLNRLELYFESVFAYSSHPTIWSNTSPYTATDLRILEAYCRERFVTLVPNQNTLGHFERWFQADASYLRYAELPKGGARTPWGSIQSIPTGLCTSDPTVIPFLRGLLEELLPCFPSAKEVNLGCDEVFDLGIGRSRGQGLASDLFFNHLTALAQIAEHFNKRPVFWADMLIRHPKFLHMAQKRLPSARWILWGYEASDPLAEQADRLSQAGIDFIVAPGSSAWRSFCGRTSNMLANIQAASAIQSQGLLLTDWGDAGHWQPLVISLPAWILAASRAWSSELPVILSKAIDSLTGIHGLGIFLLRLGDTYKIAHAETGNATKLFQAYTLPLSRVSAWDTTALEATSAELDMLTQTHGMKLGNSLLAREARFALEMQRLAVYRVQRKQGLMQFRDSLSETFRQLWLDRGPTARLEDSLAAFKQPELP